MKIDRSMLYDTAEAYFELEGSAVMRLSSHAAERVCMSLAVRGFVVVRVEGGIWREPKFESRLDCIWDGKDPPLSFDEAEQNNSVAADFVRSHSNVHNAFIVTAPPITGYVRRSRTERKGDGG